MLVRSVSATPVAIRLVSLEIRADQRVTVASTLGSTETVREILLYLDANAFRPAGGALSLTVLGIDIPVLVPIPREASPSGFFSSCGAASGHSLVVTVYYGTHADAELQLNSQFPFALKFYETLPLYRQFNEPVVTSSVLPDKLFMVETTVPILLVGPQDDFTVDVKIIANPAKTKHRPPKLAKLTLQIQEILECHEGGLVPYKETKILTTHRAFDHEIGNHEIKHTFAVKLPLRNEHLHMYYPAVRRSPKLSANETDQVQYTTLARAERISKLPPGVSVTHTQGFTHTGRLFSIRYEAVVKVKVGRAKDMEVRLPVTVSPYDRKSSNYLLMWIMKECEAARNHFGRDVVNGITNAVSDPEACRVLSPFVLPPIVYWTSKGDWIELGYEPELYGEKNTGNCASRYID